MASSNGPLSLYQYARNIAVKYINTIEDVGDIEYRIVAPVLKKITSHHQLKKLETNSPQIAGEDMELWKKFIARDFGVDSVDKWVPKDPKNWSKVYDKHQREAGLAQERAAEALKKQFDGLNSTKQNGKTQFLDPKLCPPVRRSRWGSGGGGSTWGQSSNSWDSKVGSKTKNIVQKARREAKEISRRNGTKTTNKPAGVVSEQLKRKIKTVEEIRHERENAAKESKTRGKRKEDDMDVDMEEEEEEEEEAEQERLMKAEEWRRKAAEKRTAIAQGPRARIVPRKEADPIYRPKKTNSLAMPPRR